MGDPLLEAVFNHAIEKGLCHLSLISQSFFHLSDSSVDVVEEVDVARELGVVLDDGCEFVEVVKGFGKSGVFINRKGVVSRGGSAGVRVGIARRGHFQFRVLAFSLLLGLAFMISSESIMSTISSSLMMARSLSLSDSIILLGGKGVFGGMIRKRG